MRFVEVRLQAAAGRLSALANFYGRRLGLSCERSAERIFLTIGETALEFVAADAGPYYHFALLVPGDRFAAALQWAGARTELLPHGRTGNVVFEFDHWGASACYFHDPAGNIVELIAHRGINDSSARGAFHASELVGLSELGLVGDPVQMASPLIDILGLEHWDGTVSETGLAFVGEKARTLILSPADRGWLPTARPAEVHRLEIVLSGPAEAETQLPGSRYRISRRRLDHPVESDPAPRGPET